MSDERELARDGRAEREAALDRALATLPQAEVDPLWSRATQVAALRRLHGAPFASRVARYEPLLLVLLSAAQLLWAALRVFAFAR
jgi:hypothetical protein